jgi:hypothetical protein
MLIAASLFAVLGTALAAWPQSVLADSPGQPQVDRVTALDPHTVEVVFYNSADGDYAATLCVSECEDSLRFDLRYGIAGDNVESHFTYIGPQEDLNISAQYPNVIFDNLPQPPFQTLGAYDVTGPNPDTSYCFQVRSVAEETGLLFNSYMASSNWSNSKCTRTPAQPVSTPTPTAPATPIANQFLSTPVGVLGSLHPTPDASSLYVPPPSQASVILSPVANQTTHDVLINVDRGQEAQNDGVFDLQWAYLMGGNWLMLDTGPLDQLDKTQFPNGVTLQNSLFTTFQCGSAAAPCAFRTWRVRARIHGGPPDFWSDWVAFRVQ